MDTIKTLCVFGILSVIIGFFVLFLIRFSDLTKDVINYEQLKSSVSAGEIVEKRTEKGYTAIFKGYVPIRYFFEVEWEYEKDGEVTLERKDFEVDRDVYLAYDIGDYYDSQNFRFVSETENTEVAVPQETAVSE